jgi:hypothetical protein
MDVLTLTNTELLGPNGERSGHEPVDNAEARAPGIGRQPPAITAE